MRILLDTNALYGDPLLRGPNSRLLLKAAENGEIEIVVPEIVVLEATNNFRERLETAARDLRKAQKEFKSLGVDVECELPDIDASASAYEGTLRQRLSDAGARIPGPPPIAHLDLVKRAIEKRKPFDMKGRGYRDSLIWLQVLDEAADGDVVLATANTKDFASSDSANLAPELVEELEALGLPDGRVCLADSISEVVRLHVKSSAEALKRVQASLQDEKFYAQLVEAINESLYCRETAAPDDEELRRLDVNEVQIIGVEDVHDVEIDEAYEVDPDTLAFNFGGSLVAEADFCPLGTDIAGADVPGVHVSDWNWNEWTVLASKTLDFGFEGTAEYSAADNELRSVDIWLVY